MEALSDTSRQLELFISCRNLTNKDLLSKSDPQVTLFIKTDSKWVPQGKTEIINDNLNPAFSKTFTLTYNFEQHQYLKFDVIDIDSGDRGDFIGTCEVELGKIVGAKNQIAILDLLDKNGKSGGKLIAKIEPIGTSVEEYKMQWRGINVRNVRGCCGGRSSPILRIFKTSNMGAIGGSWLKVYESEPIKDNLNPAWKAFKIMGNKICNGDYNLKLKAECLDWYSTGSYKTIGEVEFTMQDVVVQKKRQFELINSQNKKAAGRLDLGQFEANEYYDFVHYLRAGWQLNVITAIDFTGSNGVVTAPTSLHALNTRGELNQYQQTIQQVCSILLNYDYDQKIPLYGFGAKPHFPTLNSAQTLHCFPLTGIPNNAEVHGLAGIMQAYSDALMRVELSGPTFFAPIINEAKSVAQNHKATNSGVYTVLLLLTDGVIHDMDLTINAVIDAAFLPLSVIIIGVGNEDFSSMEVLDGDDGLVNEKGQRALRDLVQFVPFRKFKNNTAQLTKEVLAELPHQFTQFMKLNGIKPGKPIQADINVLVPTGQQMVQHNPILAGATTKLLTGLINPNPQVSIPQTQNYQQPQQQPQVGFMAQNPIFTNLIQQQIAQQPQYTPNYQNNTVPSYQSYQTMGQQPLQTMQTMGQSLQSMQTMGHHMQPMHQPLQTMQNGGYQTQNPQPFVQQPIGYQPY